MFKRTAGAEMRIDFLPSSLQAARRGRSILIFGLLSCIFAAIAAWYAGNATEYWQTAYHRLESDLQSGSAQPGAATDSGIKDELQAANQAVAALSIPWGRLFDGLDAADTEHVVLLSVEPSTDQKEVRISAEARSQNHMTEFLRRLRKTGVFADAILINHQIYQQDPQLPIRFVVFSHWRDVAVTPVDPVVAPPETPPAAEGAPPASEGAAQ